MRLTNTLFSIVNNRCPRCHQGKVFSHENPYQLKKGFVMEKGCSHCGELYEKEPGYFYGAMYVSYAMTMAWFFTCFLVNECWVEAELVPFLLFMVGSTLLFLPITFRWSRLIWLNFFIKYDPTKSASAKR